MVTKIILIVAIALFAIAFVEGVVLYIKQVEIWNLRTKLFDMSGLEPVFWEDAEWRES